MQPNFAEMSVPDLRAYVLKHRDDIEAIRALFHHPSLKWKTMPPMFTEDGVPIEENIRTAEEAIRQRAVIDKERQKEETEERFQQNIMEENEQYSDQSMIRVTQAEIEQFRSQLVGNSAALTALDVIQECDGYLEDAITLLIMRETGKEPDRGLGEWIQKCRKVICQEEFREELAVGFIAAAIEPLATSAGIPLGIATGIATYAFKIGMKKFCQPSDSQP